MSGHPTKALSKSLGITVFATGANLCATTHWIPSCVSPLDCRVGAHESPRFLWWECELRRISAGDLTFSLGARRVRGLPNDLALNLHFSQHIFIVLVDIAPTVIVLIVNLLHRQRLTSELF